ncbi:hypothetical protein N752_29835 [Desulforamulus aquiferis]|nr:hypothetical protein [Desulforamulus aquiferis]RYD01504.1 hypothetical protein N752_29835 [Desulforamulus aquiferis]
MSSNEKKVLQYLEENFNLSFFTVVDFPLLPGGKIVRDQKGDELLFYHDILDGMIKWKEPAKNN